MRNLTLMKGAAMPPPSMASCNMSPITGQEAMPFWGCHDKTKTHEASRRRPRAHLQKAIQCNSAHNHSPFEFGISGKSGLLNFQSSRNT